jgi:hypothetical protein
MKQSDRNQRTIISEYIIIQDNVTGYDRIDTGIIQRIGVAGAGGVAEGIYVGFWFWFSLVVVYPIYGDVGNGDNSLFCIPL